MQQARGRAGIVVVPQNSTREKLYRIRSVTNTLNVVIGGYLTADQLHGFMDAGYDVTVTET